MTTTPHLAKPTTQVNTTDGGKAQFDSQVTPLQDGGYFVVWTDSTVTYNPSGQAIVGQRYDAAGNKVGGDPLHGGEVNLIPLTAGTQNSPAVTTLANGDIAVAFVESSNTGEDIDVRIFDPSLHVIRTDNIEVSSMVEGFEPSLTALADGRYVVSYTANGVTADILDTHVIGELVSATGSVGSPFNIAVSTAKTSSAQLATLSDGNVVAVYDNNFVTNDSVTDSDIVFSILTPAGTPVRAFQGVPGAGTPALERHPTVAALHGGGFVVAWDPGDDVRASILGNDGHTVASNLLVNTSTAGVQGDPDVVALGDGGFLVTWEDGNLGLTHGQRFDAIGDKIGAEFTLNTGGSPDHRDAALLSGGRIAFAFDARSPDDIDVTTSILTTSAHDGVGAVGALAAGDFNSNGMRDYIWRDASADMTKWEYAATTQQVAQVDLGTVDFSWNILASDHFSNASAAQMLTQNVVDGTMTLWWVSAGQQLTGVDIGQHWNGIDYIAHGQFADIGGAGISNFLVTNNGDHHLYDWWIDSNFKLQGIDLGAAWSNISFVGTGEFTPNGKTDFLVSNTVDHHLYDWWIDPTSHALQGVDLGAVWNDVGYIASGKFTANGGGNDDFLVFNQNDHHLYDWWIDPTSHTLQGVDLGAAWNNAELLATGHFDNHTTSDQMLVRNTLDSHLYEWWIDPTSHALTGIDLGAHPGIEFIDSGHFNNANGTNDELLVHNTTDGHLYEWWIANNQLSGTDLII